MASLEEVLGVGSDQGSTFDKAESDAMDKRALELFEERRKAASLVK